MTTWVDSVAGDISMEDVLELLDGLDADQMREVLNSLPPWVTTALLDYTEPAHAETRPAPASPLLQARELDPGYKERAHLKYLSDRLAQAVTDVENGQSRFLVVSMPPRVGKSHLCSVNTPTWILRKHPEWKLGLISYSPTLANKWGRTIRELIRDNRDKLGVSIAKDAGAVAEWETTQKGGVTSRSPGSGITGIGFKVMIIDDIVKDFADAHSEVKRQAIWDWWLSVSQTRLERPALVIVVGTRWHQDDFIGRLLSDEYEGDPADWEVISFPAIAEVDDVLGREPGEPLMSPLVEETPEEAVVAWAKTKKNSGSYTWSALYQQSPSPSKGSIFDTDWWKFWTTLPALVSKLDDGEPDPNGKVVLLNPDEDLARARWLDSWDCAFKGKDDSDYVVGQRWAQLKARRYLIAQVRKRMTFSATLTMMKNWVSTTLGLVPYSERVHERLVEDKANGTAIIDVLKSEVSGMIAINPTTSKEARARAVTPEVEAGNVYLPYPGEPGNEWVQDLLSEAREFPTGAHDDQVDALTQALSRMRAPQRGGITVPGRVATVNTKRRGQVALENRRINR